MRRIVHPNSTWLSRAAAIFEVVGVLVAAIVLLRLVLSTLGIESWKAVQAEMLAGADRDYWLLARLASIEQILKYGFTLLLFYAIGRWHRDRRLPAYGFRSGGRSARQLIAIGIVGWAAAGILPHGLQALAKAFPVLGTGPDHWSLFPPTWSLGFLVYLAASSFLLVPIAEEIFARGYMVTRLADEFGRGGGLVLSALFFALAHTQYFKPEVLSVGMLISLLVGSIGFGYIFLRTGSLVPVIVAHALINVPTPPFSGAPMAVLVTMALVLVAARRSALEWLRGALGLLSGARWGVIGVGSLLLTASLALVAAAGPRLPYLALGLLVVSLVAHLREQRLGLPRRIAQPAIDSDRGDE